jgi:hypothetical protein
MYVIICPVNGNRNGATVFDNGSNIGVKTAFIFITDQNMGIPGMENNVDLKFG